MNLLKYNINNEIDFQIDKKLTKNKYTKYEYYLIQNGLREYYDIDSFNLHYTSNGKPYLNNNIYVSISHDNDIVVVALDTIPVGVDIQFYKEINPTFKSILNISGDDKTSTDLFSKKEAVLKLKGDIFKNIKNYNVDDYNFETVYEEDYVINCAFENCK